MIPLRDIIPTRTAPAATLTLIGINAAAFAYAHLSGLGPAVESDPSTFVLVTGFRWREILASTFVHHGWLHLVSNLVALWLFAAAVEDRMGHARFVIFYVASAFAGAVIKILITGDVLTPVGATAGTAAVIGAYFFMFPRSRVLVLLPFVVILDVVEAPALFFFGLWFGLQVIAAGATVGHSIAAGGAIWAAVAGFALGLGTVRIFLRRERLRVEWWNGK